MSDVVAKNKLNKAQMLKLKEIDEKIEQLYTMRSKIIERILEKKGDSVGYIKLEDETGKTVEKPWMRVTLIDNIMPFHNKDVVFRTAAFRRYEAKIEYLKTEPKIPLMEAQDMAELAAKSQVKGKK